MTMRANGGEYKTGANISSIEYSALNVNNMIPTTGIITKLSSNIFLYKFQNRAVNFVKTILLYSKKYV